jgi:hypothetical protein
MEYGYVKASQELDRIIAKYGTNASSYNNSTYNNSSLNTSSGNQNSISRISYNDSSISGKKLTHNSSNMSPNKHANSTSIRTTKLSSPPSISSVPPADTLQSQLGVGTTAVTNIVAAFRELQAKLKIIEEERANAYKEREETKRQLENLRKEFAIKQSTLEINTTE